MNNENIRIWLEDGHLHGEWGDCALDDDDRHLGVLLTAKVEAKEDSRETRKRLMVVMAATFDQWLTDTGRR